MSTKLKTVKDLACELGVSKQTIHRTIQKRNIETIQDGNKILLDDTAQTAIKEDLQDKTTQGGRFADDTRTIQNETADVLKRSTDDTADDLRTEYIESLKAQIEDLKADKQFLQDRLAAAEHDRDVLTKERQTILAELLSLRGQPKIKTEAAAPPQKSTSEPRPQKSPQQPRRRTLSERIRDFFK